MINNSVSVEEFRSNLAQLIGRVMYGKDRIMIKKYNRAAAVLLSVEDYEKLLDPTKRLNQNQWDKAVKKLETIRANIPEINPSVIEKEVVRAVQNVRAKKKNNNT